MGWNPLKARREREERELAEKDEFRFLRKIAQEDITVFGEQLGELHLETLTTELDDDMRLDYQRALDAYESAKQALSVAETKNAVLSVDRLLEGGRFHLACVLARRDDLPLPTRRDNCFFNPQHGPAIDDVAWTPPGGVERQIPVCRNDMERLAAGNEPDARKIRVGDRWVEWHTAGGSTASAANYRAHVISGDAPLTQASVAEAHARAGLEGGLNRMTGGKTGR